MVTFEMGDARTEHNVGDAACPSCFWSSYPRLCVCGGLVHAEYGDEDEEGYWLVRSCDRCGDDWRTVDGLI